MGGSTTTRRFPTTQLESDVQVALCCFKALNCLKPSQITYSISVEFWPPAKLELFGEDWTNMTCITYIMITMDILYIWYVQYMYMVCNLGNFDLKWGREQQNMAKMIDFVVGNT